MSYDTDWQPVVGANNGFWCPKCQDQYNYNVHWRQWTSFDGAHTDFEYHCLKCGSKWWVERGELLMNELNGSVILTIDISYSHDVIVFETDKGIFAYRTYAECCSDTWINHFTNVKDLYHQEVDHVEKLILDTIDASNSEFSGRQDSERIYGIRFHMKSGRVPELEFRNASNGYYGGDLELTGEWNKEEMKPLVEDF